MVSVDTWLNENSLDFFLYCLYASVKGKFFTSGVNLSFADDTEVSSGQLKRFKESLNFQATLYFLLYNYFYLISTVCTLSKMVWNSNQQ